MVAVRWFHWNPEYAEALPAWVWTVGNQWFVGQIIYLGSSRTQPSHWLWMLWLWHSNFEVDSPSSFNCFHCFQSFTCCLLAGSVHAECVFGPTDGQRKRCPAPLPASDAVPPLQCHMTGRLYIDDYRTRTYEDSGFSWIFCLGHWSCPDYDWYKMIYCELNAWDDLPKDEISLSQEVLLQRSLGHWIIALYNHETLADEFSRTQLWIHQICFMERKQNTVNYDQISYCTVSIFERLLEKIVPRDAILAGQMAATSRRTKASRNPRHAPCLVWWRWVLPTGRLGSCQRPNGF